MEKIRSEKKIHETAMGEGNEMKPFINEYNIADFKNFIDENHDEFALAGHLQAKQEVYVIGNDGFYYRITVTFRRDYEKGNYYEAMKREGEEGNKW